MSRMVRSPSTGLSSFPRVCGGELDDWRELAVETPFSHLSGDEPGTKRMSGLVA